MFKINFGFTPLSYAAAALYIVAALASIYGKWVAIGTITNYFVLKLIIAAVTIAFTDAVLHLAAPTAFISIYAAIAGESKKNTAAKIAGFAAILISFAAVYIDYKVVNYSGVTAAAAAYEKEVGKISFEPNAGVEISTPLPKTSVILLEPKIPANLAKLAKSGNLWAKDKVEIIKAATEKQNQIAQLKVAAQQSEVAAEVAKAAAEKQKTEKAKFELVRDEQKRKVKRGEKAEELKGNFFSFLSLLSSFGQLLALAVLAYMGYIKGLHKDKNFYNADVDFLVVGGEKEEHTSREVSQSQSNSQQQQHGFSDTQTLSENNSNAVRKSPQQMTVAELVTYYENTPKKSLQDAYSKVYRRANEYKSEGKTAAFSDNLEYANRLKQVADLLHGKD